MKRRCLCFLLLLGFIVSWGCAATKIDPNTLQSPDERALYELMIARGRALNARDMNQFRQIYTDDSPELDWIEHTGIPMWKQNGMRFNEPSLQKISIIGNDAAASFVLSGSNSSGTSFGYQVEVLYGKKDSQWKIESTGAR